MDEEANFVLKDKTYFVKSDKNNEFKIIFSIYNNDVVDLTIYTTNIIPKKNLVFHVH